MPPRPATLNQKDCKKARRQMSDAFQLLDSAWRLIQGVERREQQQHGSTGRTDQSQAAKNRRTAKKRRAA